MLRAAGLALLAAFGWLWGYTCRLAGPSATPAQCAVALLAFGCLSVGMALACEGQGLFRPVPVPPRAWLP
jgi:hypothetical protein